MNPDRAVRQGVEPEEIAGEEAPAPRPALGELSGLVLMWRRRAANARHVVETPTLARSALALAKIAETYEACADELAILLDP